MQINIFSRRHKDTLKVVSLIFILAINFAPATIALAAASSSDSSGSSMGETSGSSDAQATSPTTPAEDAPSFSLDGNAAPASDDTSLDPTSDSSQSPSAPSSPPPPSSPTGGGGTSPTATGQNVFSYQSATPQVDGATGALTQKIQLDIPPGRNGMQPDLSLIYNSRNTDQDSIVGYGWSLSIPYIERLNKTGSQDIYGPNAYFTSSLDGELAVASGTMATATTSATVNVLLVGGGGGGGGGKTAGSMGGGGGGGDYNYQTGVTVQAQTYTVTIGTAGTAGTAGASPTGGGDGGSSSLSGSGFTTITAIGGGGGAPVVVRLRTAEMAVLAAVEALILLQLVAAQPEHRVMWAVPVQEVLLPVGVAAQGQRAEMATKCWT